MSDFEQKILANPSVQNSMIATKITGQDSMVVPLVSGSTINVPMSQIPSTSNLKVSTWVRYNSNGDLSSMLSGPGTALIQVNRGSGSGPIQAAYLRLQIQNNTGSPCQLCDIPHLINNLTYQTPSGATIQILTGDVLFNSLVVRNYDNESYLRMSPELNLGPLYGPGLPIANGATIYYYLPIQLDWMAASGFCTFLSQGDLNLYVQFNPVVQTVILGSAPTLTQMSLDLKQSFIANEDTNMRKRQLKKMPLYMFCPYPRYQSFTQTIDASNTYTFYLSGIKGQVVFIEFMLRQSLNGSAVNVLTPISEFQFYNSQGDQLCGQPNVSGDRNLSVQSTSYYPSKYTAYRNLYSYVFSAEDAGSIACLSHNGLACGGYPFDTNNYLTIWTAQAGTNEIQSLYLSATVGTTYQSGATPAQWWLSWNDCNTVCYATFPINATNTQIQNAIQAMPNFLGTITASNTLIASNILSLTFGGQYANTPLATKGLQFQVVNSEYVQTNAPLPIFSSINIATNGVFGMTNGTYTLTVIAYEMATIKCDEGGNLTVMQQ